MNTALTLHQIEGEPRVLDTDLAERLGMSTPANIRKNLIEPNRAELESFGVLARLAITSGAKGGRPGTAFYLNEEQAVLVVMFSRTPKAAEARREIIAVFTAWRRGELPTVAAPALTTRGGIALADSREVAKSFEKRHDHVIRDIDMILAGSPDLGNQWFQQVTAFNEAANKPTRHYEMTRDGFSLLAMGWTGKKALAFKVAYIDRFNAMDAALKAPPAVAAPAGLELIGEALKMMATSQARMLDMLAGHAAPAMVRHGSAILCTRPESERCGAASAARKSRHDAQLRRPRERPRAPGTRTVERALGSDWRGGAGSRAT